MKWLRPATNGNSPCPRCAHTTEFAGKLFIYGGWDGSRMLGDMFILHPDSMTWSIPITTGPEPPARAGHSCTAVGTKLLLWGGGDGTDYLNDLHVLDTETMAWCKAYSAGTPPSARSRHSATLISDNQIIFIGGGGDTCVYNDAYILNTDSMSWSRANLKGTPPTARWGHTATLVDGKLIIYGGHDGTAMLDDLIVLDITAMRWEKPRYPGMASAANASTPPAPSTNGSNGSGNGICPANGGSGGGGGGSGGNGNGNGGNANGGGNSSTGSGHGSGDRPPPLAGHTATLLKVAGKNCILYFGGGDGNEIYKDAFLLDVQTFQWSKPVMVGPLPAARCAHTSNLIGDKLLVFGGGDGSRRFKDIYLLDLRELIGDSQNLTTSNGNKKTPRLNMVNPNQRAVNGNRKQSKCRPAARYAYPGQSSSGVTPQTSPRMNSSPGSSPPSTATSSPSPSGRSSLIISPPPPPPPFSSKPHPSFPSSSSPPNSPRNIPIPTNPLRMPPPASSHPVALWLQSIGMSQYIENFLREDVDMDVLPHLTELHLQQLQVNTLGARLRILAHIKTLPKPKKGPPNGSEDVPQDNSKPLSRSGSKTNPLPQTTTQSTVSMEEVNQLRRELATRSADLARMEALYQHLLSVMRPPNGVMGYGYSFVPPPPPPPTMGRPVHIRTQMPQSTSHPHMRYPPPREVIEEVKMVNEEVIIPKEKNL
eukprot:TRINITY_DN4049_c0_g1_i1.p1 TRINITY_DN4049_c0_g1~~TRINITY_DN4049_c0_g1_i1.p1  ORF type:complete len:705 (+),score=121.63 TRINITY_DN4049_c0_g1_i1:171-2285(+)